MAFELRISKENNIFFKLSNIDAPKELRECEFELTIEELARLYSLAGNGVRAVYLQTSSTKQEPALEMILNETEKMDEFLEPILDSESESEPESNENSNSLGHNRPKEKEGPKGA